MPPNHHVNPPRQKPARAKVNGRYIMSSRAQAVLTWVLEEIIDNTLETARQMAESTGKNRVELAEIESALKQICDRYHTRWTGRGEAIKGREGAPKPGPPGPKDGEAPRKR